MKISNKENNIEKRDDPRIEYSGHIFFITKDGFYEGDLTDYSEHGLFVRTSDILPVGSVLTIALPYLDGHVKRKGQVVRASKNGFGVELFRDDHEPYQKVTLREMKISSIRDSNI
jgi:hypothetical protein